MTVPHVAIQQVEANVCRGALHPLGEDPPLIYIEVVRDDVAGGRRLPVEFLRYFRPEPLRVLQRLFVELLVFVEGAKAGLLDDMGAWLVDSRHRGVCIRVSCTLREPAAPGFD